jgi:FkbM family methyltransferase
MLIKIKDLRSNFNVSPKGVLHVGAHLAEEAKDYKQFNWGEIVWVESQQEKAEHIRNLLNPDENTVIEATVWSESGIPMDFNVASNGESSSVLEFGSHSKSYPNITYTKKVRVITKRLDEILPVNFQGDFLNLDIQGAELEALKGISSRINEFKWIYTEVNKEEVYKGCATVDKIDEFLLNYGYKRVATRWILKAGWGDALYIHSDLIRINSHQKINQLAKNIYFYGIQLLRILKKQIING